MDELRLRRASIDGELFKSSICIQRQNLTFLNLKNSQYDTWFIVQIWQDWLRQSFCEHEISKQAVGTTYRVIAKGSDAYLGHYIVYSKLLAYEGKSIGSWDLKTVQEDLKIMKDFAQEKVKPLVVNNSMLDVEECGIRHLTCTNIEHHELPWINRTNA